VDLQGRLSNPGDAFVAAVGPLPTALIRDTPLRRAPHKPQRQRRLSSSEIRSLVQQRQQGVTIERLAQGFAVHRTKALAHLARARSLETDPLNRAVR
jgi:hypothetical protein